MDDNSDQFSLLHLPNGFFPTSGELDLAVGAMTDDSMNPESGVLSISTSGDTGKSWANL